MLSMDSLISPLRWLYTAITDQTHIRLMLPEFYETSDHIVPIVDRGNNAGKMPFAISTASNDIVEILAIEVHFSHPLQLRDPGNRGFFRVEGTNDTELPFKMAWRGTVTLKAEVLQAFVLSAECPVAASIHDVKIVIHSRRQHRRIGGFLVNGRVKVHSFPIQAALTTEPVLDIALPPRWCFTSPQPYIIEGAIRAASPGGGLYV